MKHNNDSGFTLIEVLVAIALLSIGLLALGMMQAYFAEGNARSRQLTHATDVGINKVEELANDNSLSAGSYSETVTDYPLRYVLNWTVTNDTTPTGARVFDIDLSVNWSSDGRSHAVNYNWIREE